MTQTPGTINNNLKRILYRVNQILEHQTEIAILKGETFNLFSILKMESKENDTHSAFLGELLNPKGSHYFGSTFLKLFLKQVGDETLEADTATVFLEYSLGTNDQVNKTGGRVDIYIKDATKNTICIENKIYASDQPNQLKRYANHNKTKNSVYYLTLNGADATEESKDDLEIDVDYNCISYHTTIIDWLEACLKEAADQPIIRESIKQYIILLKKLANQLSDTKMEKEIKDLIINNYQAARTISSNIEPVELEYTEKFLQEIKTYVHKVLNANEVKFSIVINEDLSKPWSGLRIFHEDWPPEIRVQLQGNNKIPWTNTHYGIVAHNNLYNRRVLHTIFEKADLTDQNYKENLHWAYYDYIIDFGNLEERTKLFDTKKREALVKKVSDKLIDLVRLCETSLINLPLLNTNP